jgi:hypothetical protein
VPVVRKTNSCSGSQVADNPHWPFATWGLDIVGPFGMTKGGITHILVAIGKFTKWIEVKSVARIIAAKLVEFVFKIMNRYGVNRIDNGSHFTAAKFKYFYSEHHIKIQYA